MNAQQAGGFNGPQAGEAFGPHGQGFIAPKKKIMEEFLY